MTVNLKGWERKRRGNDCFGTMQGESTESGGG